MFPTVPDWFRGVGLCAAVVLGVVGLIMLLRNWPNVLVIVGALTIFGGASMIVYGWKYRVRSPLEAEKLVANAVPTSTKEVPVNPGKGGDINIRAGDGKNGASGGDINIRAGDGDGGSDGSKGGDVVFRAGDGADAGTTPSPDPSKGPTKHIGTP